MKRIAAILVTGILFFNPVNIAAADQPSPIASVMPHGDDGRNEPGPRDRIHEEDHGFEGAGMFLVGGAVVIAIGLAFLIGRRSKKSE